MADVTKLVHPVRALQALLAQGAPLTRLASTASTASTAAGRRRRWGAVCAEVPRLAGRLLEQGALREAEAFLCEYAASPAPRPAPSLSISAAYLRPGAWRARRARRARRQA